ncbi:MAG TPA: class F sortase [Dehalococcoidia bacterium]|nr:class F sortase [Dehalococcoidia bacterium]
MRRPVFLAAYVIGMAVIGFALILFVPRAMKLRSAHKPPTVAAVVTATATAAATVAPTPIPTPLPFSEYPAGRLVVPALKINAPWGELGFMADGVTMASPVGPQDLGWYNFTDEPGGSSNAVFSGHVDWYTGAAAIFRGVSSLKEGDEIDVSREDGRLRTYHVTAVSKPNQNADATDIIADTDMPTVTLITCVGDWNPVTHEYSNRLVVVAQAPKGG